MTRWTRLASTTVILALLAGAPACEGSMTAEPGGSGDRDAGTMPDARAGADGAAPGTTDAGTSAADGGAARPTVGALAGLPSAPGPHVDAIAALGPDTWMQLERPAPDPDHGTARGRSWGGRAFALAPTLRGAFFTGEGVHAFVKPDGRGMDDVWFYDIHANRWIAVYPGTDTATFNARVASGELSIDGDGQLTEAGGGLVPVHVLIHAWDFLSYDTDRERFAFIAGDGLGRYYMPGLDAIDEGLTTLEAQREERPPVPMSPWYYDPYEGVFTRERAENDAFDVGGYSAFVYVPFLGLFINAGSGGVQTYDPEANRWELVDDTGPRPPGYDHGVCYDRVRRRLYMGPGDDSGGMYVYDIESRTWAHHPGGPPEFRTNGASVFYDEANDVVVIFRYHDGTRWVFDPATNEWASAPIPSEVTSAVPYASHNAFYDPALNAYFVYMAPDSDDTAAMFVYRYQ